MEWIANGEIWASLLTLTALEVVLGIDNVIFISVIAARLPEHQRAKARRLGLLGALGLRIVLLAGIVWLVGLTRPLFEIFGWAASWRDLILMAGGLFLLTKGTSEIHHTVEGQEETGAALVTTTFTAAIVQIMLLDVVFSIDSVITAVGMTQFLPVMIAAVTIAIIVMMVAAGALSRFIEAHPTTKMLALSFLLLIGVALIADGLHFHIPRGYLYFAIAFSAGVEGLNILARKKRRRAKQEEA